MLLASRNDPKRLDQVFQTIQRHVNNPHYLNKLSQDIFQYSRNDYNVARHEPLLRIAYAFGLHLTKLTKPSGNGPKAEASSTVASFLESPDSVHRKTTVQWLVNCASEIGLDSVLHLMNSWKQYFTPGEAVRLVATSVLTANACTTSKLCTHMHELGKSARKLAVECALQDPANCALHSLSLCEKDQFAFDTIAQAVENAGKCGHVSAGELFTIARYMEHHGVLERACKIALLASDRVYIPINADTHLSIGDLQWACSLAQSLGTQELTDLIKILVKNVHCAPVLSDMLRRCSQFTAPYSSSSSSSNKHSSSMHHHSMGAPSLLSSCPAASMVTSRNGGAGESSPSAATMAAVAANLGYMDLTMDDRSRRYQYKTYSLDRPPVSILLNAAVKAYIETIMTRLEHISPRHYSDFIEFLSRAQETIVLAHDGKREFCRLLDKIKMLYKGKKKLMFLVKERFG